MSARSRFAQSVVSGGFRCQSPRFDGRWPNRAVHEDPALRQPFIFLLSMVSFFLVLVQKVTDDGWKLIPGACSRLRESAMFDCPSDASKYESGGARGQVPSESFMALAMDTGIANDSQRASWL